MPPSRSATSYSTGNATDTLSKTRSRPLTGKSRPRTAATSTGYFECEVICAVSESRGVSPTVGLSFMNLSTYEAVLCQFADTQTYARTCHKIQVFSPTEILYMTSAADSKMISILKENLETANNDILMTDIDRKYWSDITGHEYIQCLAFPACLQTLQLSLESNFFAVCCFAAVMRYIELGLSTTFAAQALRIRFEPSEGSMMIDFGTISSLELIQNSQNSKSKDCLYGLLNETMTIMGARYLRSNLLQPTTDMAKVVSRHEALEELVTKEDTFIAVRGALKDFVDTDKVLAALVVLSTKIDMYHIEQRINHVLMLKTFVDSIKPIWQALTGTVSADLRNIRELCDSNNFEEVEALIRYALNDAVMYSKTAVELRTQHVFAIRAGVNGFLDVSRKIYKEVIEDINAYVARLKEQHDIGLDLKFDVPRQYYVKFPALELEDKQLPEEFINVYRKKSNIECQTLDLLKLNQKLKDAHNEVISMSDQSVQDLIENVRSRIHPLFKISEAIAFLDMLAAFAQVATTFDYARPEITDTIAVKAGRHPVRDKIQKEKYVPNDVYADQPHRFQIITGCNMSGKSTYIRSIALMCVMAQIGCFVPAEYASFPLVNKLFARVSTDDSVEANVSTFASEMREMAFMLGNVTPHSLVVVDELGRGTSTTDGLAIAIAISEALIESNAFTWFVTHFRDLPRILAERAGVVNLHLAVDIAEDFSRMKMMYKIAEGYEEEKFYGIALARVIGLPPKVMDVAMTLSTTLNDQISEKRCSATKLTIARRRKLVLSLKQQLQQANDSNMQPQALKEWLKRLQDEFTVRMSALDASPEETMSSTRRTQTPQPSSGPLKAEVRSAAPIQSRLLVKAELPSPEITVSNLEPRACRPRFRADSTSIKAEFCSNGDLVDDPIVIDDD